LIKINVGQGLNNGVQEFTNVVQELPNIGQELPDVVQEFTNFGRNQNFIFEMFTQTLK
jgi:hypothetical protein